jgi:hypothetical protein
MSCKTSGRNGEVDRILSALGRGLNHAEFTRIRKMADLPISVQCLAEPYLNNSIRTMLYTTAVQFYMGTEGLSQGEAEEKASYILAPDPVTQKSKWDYDPDEEREPGQKAEAVAGKTYMDNRTMYAFYSGLMWPHPSKNRLEPKGNRGNRQSVT